MRHSTRRSMTLVLSAAWSLSACQSLPAKRHSAAPPGNEPQPSSEATPRSFAVPPISIAPAPTAEDLAAIEPPEIPPCLPVDATPKTRKRKSKPVVHVEPAPPVVTPPPAVAADAGVREVSAPSSSILGRKVRGLQGDDLGRVVDVLADAQGRVRVAIIEFGGFLGVGNRRIAVDWSLLKFHPNEPDAPVVLDVPRRELAATPEYKGSAHPLALMAPAVPAAPRQPTPN